jgi:hypothetical protein
MDPEWLIRVRRYLFAFVPASAKAPYSSAGRGHNQVPAGRNPALGQKNAAQ